MRLAVDELRHSARTEILERRTSSEMLLIRISPAPVSLRVRASAGETAELELSAVAAPSTLVAEAPRLPSDRTATIRLRTTGMLKARPKKAIRPENRYFLDFLSGF